MLFFLSGLAIGVICTAGAAVLAVMLIKMLTPTSDQPAEWADEFYVRRPTPESPSAIANDHQPRSINLCR